MKLNALAATVVGLALAGTATAQTIQPNGQYTPAPQPMTGTVIQPATYTVPSTGTTTYSTMPAYGTTYSTVPQPMSNGMAYGSNQFFPTSMPGSTILNGTTSVLTNTGATVVTGTRRVVRRGLGIFRR